MKQSEMRSERRRVRIKYRPLRRFLLALSHLTRRKRIALLLLHDNLLPVLPELALVAYLIYTTEVVVFGAGSNLGCLGGRVNVSYWEEGVREIFRAF
jgi:hypothetical protein